MFYNTVVLTSMAQRTVDFGVLPNPLLRPVRPKKPKMAALWLPRVADEVCRNARHNSKVRNVVRNDRTSAYDRTVSNRDSTKDRAITAKR
jgi:hypothetical protein